MTDWSPNGAPFSISQRASGSSGLEHAYRRLIKLYPASFRRENTEEIIAVLLATAREDQRRPSVAEAADLVRGALRMRLGLGNCPRSVLYAVRLMYLGALAEVAVLATLLTSVGGIEAAGRTAALRSVGPHAGSAVTQQALTRAAGIVGTDLTADVAVVLFGIMTWLFLAWANGKGFPYARVGTIIVFVFYTAAESMDLSQGAATVAPAPTIASLVVMSIGLAVVALLLTKRSWDYYARHAVAR